MNTISKCMGIVNDLHEHDSEAVLSKLEEYQKEGIPAARAQTMAVADVLAEVKADHAELMSLAKEQHPDAFAEEPEVETLKASTLRNPTNEQAADDKVGISHVLMALGAKDWLYESKVSNAKTIPQIAKDKGVTQVREDDIGGGVKEWKITLPPTVDTDTGKSRPGRSAYLRQKGNEVWIDAEITGEGSGGSKIYDIGFNYAHNNGLVFIGDRNGFSKVAQIRRLENMINAAIKYGSTDFMAPHANQVLGSSTVPALRWVKGDTLGNLRRMIDVSQAAMQNKQPALAAVQYDRQKDSFTDSESNPLGYDDLHDLAGAFRPVDGSGGAGVTTLQRSALYRSLLQSSGARLAFLDAIRGLPGTRGQGIGGALEGTHYSTERVTDTPEFKDWAQGLPVYEKFDDAASDRGVFKLYHATTKDFTEFKPGGMDPRASGPAIWLSTDPSATSASWRVGNEKAGFKDGANVMPVYARMKNPLVLDSKDTLDWARKVYADSEFPQLISQKTVDDLKEDGYDSIIYKHGDIFGKDAQQNEAIVFDPTQIKSATGNNGKFDPTNPDIRASTERVTEPFYSALARGIDGLSTGAAPAAGWKDTIKGLVKAGKIKQDEVEWSGVNDWLDMQNGKVTKAQLQDYLKNNGVQVHETQLGDVVGQRGFEDRLVPAFESRGYGIEFDENHGGATYFDKNGEEVPYFELPLDLRRLVAATSNSAPSPKYSQYTLPGGTNYREVLLTLPVQKKQNVLEARDTGNGYWEAWNHTTGESEQEGTEREVRDYVAETSKNLASPINTADYRSTHWDQPNVLAHIRVNDRTDADGKRVLFVEELQSDWGQQGKKHGFKISGGNLTAKESDRLTELALKDPAAMTAEENKELMRLMAKMPLSESEEIANKERVPTAPFVTKTEGWLNLALKRVIKMAVDEGYDKVAFVNGDQSAERYDLSKQVSKIDYRKAEGGGFNIGVYDTDGRAVLERENMPLSDIEEYLGKDIAKKIADGDGVTHKQNDLYKSLSGLDLKVGGEGMKAFYDSIVPKAAARLAEKLGGAKMDTAPILIPKKAVEGWDSLSEEERYEAAHELLPHELEEYRNTKSEPAGFTLSEQPAFDITPKMRASAAGGLPMFSTARERWDDALDNVAQYNLKSDFLSNVRDSVVSPFMASTDTELSAWQKTIGTPFHKAMMNKAYKRVFDGVQKFIEDTSLFSSKAEQAGAYNPDGTRKKDYQPIMFPSVELTWDTINPFSKKNRGLSSEENANVGKMLSAGTLHEGLNPDTNQEWTDEELLKTKTTKSGKVEQNPKTKQPYTADEIREERRANPHYGRVWTDAEMRSQFNATDTEIKAYHEARAAITQSLEDYAKSEMGQVVRTLTVGMSDEAKAKVQAMVATIVRGDNSLADAHKQLSDIVDLLEKAGAKDVGGVRTRINGIAGEVAKLSSAGYSPLMRFGTWAVQGVNAAGEQVFFALAQNKAEAARLQRALENDPEIKNVAVGELNTQALSVFRGMTPETAQLFAEHNGMGKDAAVQAYLRNVISSRSVLQRMQKRKGVEGYSNDATRTVASFITGNSRKASSNLHMADIGQAVVAPDLKGSYQVDADKLVEYVKNPQEEAQKLRGLLFANYLGGSIASGLVNLSQPVMMTFPYLSQFGVARAGTAMKSAVREAGTFMRNKAVADKDLQAALDKAKADGILDPNEVFQLMAAAQRGTGSFGMQKFMRIWGMNFQLTEAFNRSTTFIAAYRTATETLKDADGQAQLQKAMNTDKEVTAADFAAHAIRETQGVYNKGNRPNWARGALGSTVFTFKQFSISYLEFLKRAWGAGLMPKKQFMVAIGMLFLASGVNGLPGSDDLDDILDTIGRLLGYNTNSKKFKRDLLRAAVGKDFAEALQDGVSHYLPFDIAGRMGAGNFLPATKLLDPTQTASQKLQSAMEIGGVAGSTINNYVNAIGSIAKGDARAAALVAMPVAAQNLYKAGEMAATGEAKDMGGRKIRDVDGMDALVKAIGLQPRSLADDTTDNKIAQADIGTVRWKQQSLNAEYAKAIVSGDKDKLAEVRKDLADWNRNNPKSRVQLDMTSVQNQVKTMRMTRDQRTVKAAPKSIKQDVRETVEG